MAMTHSAMPAQVEVAPIDRPRARLDWIDAARGLGITLVVIGHVWRGIDSSALISNHVLFETVDRIIYSFHMPLFFFLSGLVFKVQERPNMATALSSRVARLLWPLVLWTWIYFSFKLVAGSLANTPLKAGEFPFFPLPPREQFWFLWALLLVQISALLYLPWARRAWGWPLAMAVATAASVIAYLCLSLSGLTAGPYLHSAILHLPYFLAGIAYARLSSQLPASGGSFPCLVLFTAIVAIGVFLRGSVIDLIVGLVASVALTTALRQVAHRETFAFLRDLLARLGMASMAIYVAHVIFTASTRIGLKMAGIEGLAPHLILGSLAGIVFPFALYHLAKRARVTNVVGF